MDMDSKIFVMIVDVADLSKKDNSGEHNRKTYAIPYQRIRSYYQEGKVLKT